MIIRLRRGLEANRMLFTPALGEPFFTYDTKKLYVGDGVTPGGIPVDTNSGGGGSAGDGIDTEHRANTSNPHQVTKEQVGLSNVPNTDFTAAVASNTAKRSYPVSAENKLATIESGAQVNAVTSVNGQTGAVVVSGGEGGGITDHGALSGLGDDDHPQYLNNTRGDTRYYQKSEVDTQLSGKSPTSHNHDSTYAPIIHTHPIADIEATGGTTESFLKKDGTWSTPTNTTYSIPTQGEAELGTATTARAYSAQRVNQAIQALAPVKSVAGKAGAVTLDKADVGLTNVDNTSDATKKLDIMQTLYPVGTIYTNKTNATNPAALFGFGTWVAITGRTIVGKAASGTFATAGAAVGAETAAPTNLYAKMNVSDGGFLSFTRKTVASWTRTHNQGIGGLVPNATPFTEGTELGGTHTTIQPSLVAYMWERTE